MGAGDKDDTFSLRQARFSKKGGGQTEAVVNSTFAIYQFYFHL